MCSERRTCQYAGDDLRDKGVSISKFVLLIPRQSSFCTTSATCTRYVCYISNSFNLFIPIKIRWTVQEAADITNANARRFYGLL